jgi:hypothetical protein
VTHSAAAAHAERWLSRLMDQLGAAGLAAAAMAPGLLAMIDQHAAAVRDILLLGVEGSAVTVGAILLAGYARGLLDARGVDLRGVRGPVDGQWSGADWVTMRLLAVCALSSRADAWPPRMPEVGPPG